MEAQGGVAQLTAWAGQLEPVHWLAISTAIAFMVLIAVLLMQTSKQAQRRRQRAQRAGGAAPQPMEIDPGAALEGITLSPIDSVFPRQPARFLMLVALIAVGCWVAGYALAPNTTRFLTSVEWLFQPFYIAAHLVTLRLFINVFTRNYAAGVSRLKVSRAEALRGIRPILGPWGALAAAVIAAPFCWFDLQYLLGPGYERMGEGVLAIDYLMWGIWSVEWFINAFVWVLLVSFMVKNCMTIARYPFRQRIDAVLAEKLYRPFLQMSAQGSTVVLGFSAVTVLYLYVTGGELTDYLGLAITVALLIVCFVPPWLLLREKVERAVRQELHELRLSAGLAGAAGAGVRPAMAGAAERSLEERMDEVVALLRMWHLQNLYGGLGQTEATAIVLRLLAPAATIGWQVFQHYGALMERIGRFLGAAGGL